MTTTTHPPAGRPRTHSPPKRAGLLLLAWARAELEAGRPGALVRLAGAVGVSVRTVQRWMVSPIGSEDEPGACQALAIRREAGVPVEAWAETVPA